MFEPIFASPFEIRIHITFALVALLVGPLALFRSRRDLIHKSAGYVWIIAMVGLSLSSLFIKSDMAVLGYFGPIHVLSVYALWGVSQGLYFIRKGKVPSHRAAMQSVWFGAMGFAGLFTLLPGRVMNRVVFGDAIWLGTWAVGIGVIALLVLRRWHLRRVSM